MMPGPKSKDVVSERKARQGLLLEKRPLPERVFSVLVGGQPWSLFMVGDSGVSTLLTESPRSH
jgi:hypothetical protein